ncbi:T-cell surface antigen CD2-like isoform X2 [Megalobrama amblycephala]|uniref:T-cell surface antigen CD2-like isoform X2 n=1 Tax=Megalobrama amblycephala TaxID=75352 RepID=UPI00201418B7|nr:T-cell surface antigen CD2-like isoform X2 [Megalobrama amblycephala]
MRIRHGVPCCVGAVFAGDLPHRHGNGVFATETTEIQSVSVMEGDSVTLYIDDTEIQKRDNILWKYGAEKQIIAEISRNYELFYTHNGTDGRFRDRLKLDDQTGSLTITNITTEHAGDYKLEIRGVDLTTKTFNVSVYARLPVPVISSNSSQCSSSSSSSSNCSLVCSAVNVSHVTLSWYKGNSLLSSISVSDLSISLSLPLEVEYQDKNTYSCVLNNSFANQTRHLNITHLCHTCAAPPVSVSLIVLISAGSLLIVAAVGIFCICRKCRKLDREVRTGEEEITYAEPSFYKRNIQKSKAGEEDHVVYAPLTMRR